MGRDPLYRCSACQIRDDTGGANFGWAKEGNQPEETVIGSAVGRRWARMQVSALGVQRTSQLQCKMSANDPKRAPRPYHSADRAGPRSVAPSGCDCPYAATGVCRSQSRAVKKSKAPDPRQPGTATDSNRSYPVTR